MGNTPYFYLCTFKMLRIKQGNQKCTPPPPPDPPLTLWVLVSRTEMWVMPCRPGKHPFAGGAEVTRVKGTGMGCGHLKPA